MVHMAIWLKRHFRIALMLLMGFAVLPSYLRAFKLTGASAAPTINIGDRFLVNEAAYDLRLPYSHLRLLRTGTPKRGDIVQLMVPEIRFPIIKRVVGLPGETVEFRENRVLINGRVLPLSVLKRGEFNWIGPVNHIGSDVYNEDGHWVSFTPGQGPSRNHAPVNIGAHEFYLVGDNRDQSLDSRVWGPVAEDRILGKVILTYVRSK
jgi:signal peptidase I